MWYKSLNDKIFHNHPGYRGKPRIMPISRIIIIIMSNRETSDAFRSRKFWDQKLSSKFSAFQNPIFESRNFSVDHVVIRVACVILTQLNVRNRIFRVLIRDKKWTEGTWSTLKTFEINVWPISIEYFELFLRNFTLRVIGLPVKYFVLQLF